MHITLTGNLGSGKSTICEILNKKYGFEIYSTGKIQRKMAEERGMDVLEMNKHMGGDIAYDRMIDDATAKTARENTDKNIVFDSRLAWNFVEKSFKVFLTVSLDVASERVFNDKKRGEVENYETLEECRKRLVARANSEDERFKRYYSLDYLNFNNYDLVLDSSHCTPEFLAETIVKFAAEAEGKQRADRNTVLFSPERLGIKIDGAKASNTYFVKEGIKIRKNTLDYELSDGKELLEEAAAEGCALVSCELVS